MNKSPKIKKSAPWRAVFWIFSFVFLTLGILNWIYIDLRPALFYIIIATLYLPSIRSRLAKWIRPNYLNIILLTIAILIIWGTLGVGDLFELFEDHVNSDG